MLRPPNSASGVSVSRGAGDVLMQNLSNANGSLSGGGGLAMTSLKPFCRMADGDAFHAEP